MARACSRLPGPDVKPLLHFAIDGPARLSDCGTSRPSGTSGSARGRRAADARRIAFSRIPAHDFLDDDPHLGLGAAGGTTAGTVSFYDIDTFCRRKPSGLAGTWTGRYQSSKYPRVRGGFTVTFVPRPRAPTRFTGSIVIAGSDCTRRGRLTAQISGNRVTFGIINAERTIRYVGTLRGDSLSGSYVTPSCGDDRGGWRRPGPAEARTACCRPPTRSRSPAQLEVPGSPRRR